MFLVPGGSRSARPSAVASSPRTSTPSNRFMFASTQIRRTAGRKPAEHHTRPAYARPFANQCLAVDFAHDDVDRADDGGHVGDQAAAAEFVRHAQVAEATRPRPHTQ